MRRAGRLKRIESSVKCDGEERGVFRSLFLVNFLITLGFGMADVFFPVYASSSGANGLHLGLIFSGYGAAKTLMCPVIGWLSDRRGRRGLIIAGL